MASRARWLVTSPKSRKRTKDLPGFDPSPSFPPTVPPNPNQVPCQGASHNTKLDRAWMRDPYGVKTWNPVSLSSRRVYSLLSSAVVPRPVAMLSTVSSDDQPNLTLSSFFSLVAHKPPLLSISFPMTSPKTEETRSNIIASKQFTVSLVSEPFVEAANVLSIEVPQHVDMWELSGLTMARSFNDVRLLISDESQSFVKPTWVKESGVAFECELYKAIDIREPERRKKTQTMVLGLIKRIHVRRSVLGDYDTVDPARLRAVSRVGAMYARIGEGYDLRRLNWNDVREAYESRPRRRNGGGGRVGVEEGK